jgi:hypothetical protein
MRVSLEEIEKNTETQQEVQMKTEAEIGFMQLQSKEHLRIPETPRGKTGFSLRAFGGILALVSG